HAARERRDRGASLSEAEDVVNEEQDIAPLLIAEVLRDSQASQSDAQARARRLVHLAEDHCQLFEYASLGHLMVEVVALAGPLAHSGEDREAAGLLGNVVD